MRSPWFHGEALLLTYCAEELLGTKMRALYQRKKGRDLFDLSESLTRIQGSSPDRLSIASRATWATTDCA